MPPAKAEQLKIPAFCMGEGDAYYICMFHITEVHWKPEKSLHVELFSDGIQFYLAKPGIKEASSFLFAFREFNAVTVGLNHSLHADREAANFSATGASVSACFFFLLADTLKHCFKCPALTF